LDKAVSLQLNKGRKVTGTLRGYDQFMNLVLAEAVEELSGDQRNNIGSVVLRGNSILQVKSLPLFLVYLLLLLINVLFGLYIVGVGWLSYLE
jgi:small nuclear ribonucleoprotein G